MWANYEQKKFYSTGTNDDLLSGLRYDLYRAKRHVLQEVHEICIWNAMYIHMYHLKLHVPEGIQGVFIDVRDLFLKGQEETPRGIFSRWWTEHWYAVLYI